MVVTGIWGRSRADHNRVQVQVHVQVHDQVSAEGIIFEAVSEMTRPEYNRHHDAPPILDSAAVLLAHRKEKPAYDYR